MQTLPANIYSVASVREIDRLAIEEHGVPGYTLMTSAAAAAVRDARTQFPDATRWQVICGPGNNAGDGYVVARLAAQDGIVVSAVTLIEPDQLRGDAATAYNDFAAEGGIVMRWDGNLDTESTLLIDAMLGSGLERLVEGDYAAAVAAINAHPSPVHALDIATGIHGDTGEVLGCAVLADLTTTFVGLKAGLFLGDGPNYCGRICFADLDIPEACRQRVEMTFRRIDERYLAAVLPKRRRGAHKGDFGHVLVVGGGPGMPGAARLCAEAALRAGAGRVSVATHPDHAMSITSTRPELMCRGVASGDELAEMLANADVVAFGPGLGQSEWAQSMYAAVASVSQSTVWDADALNLLAKEPKSIENRIITPHPGEAATLLQCQSSSVQADRPDAVTALVGRYGGVAVLKGAGTLIAAGDGAPVISTAGNPGMAAAGMGDVLTGIIAALLAQGLSLADAAKAGVEVHARAGDIAAEGGERGMLASDLLEAIRSVVNP